MLTTTRVLMAVAVLAVASGAAASDAKRSVRVESGLTMQYREAGRAGAPPLVLLHGLGDTSRSFTLMIPELAREHHVFALDLRGHGDTTSPSCCYSLPVLAADVVGFMDALNIETAAVAGHSLGSFVAQHLAAAHPQRVSRLVLMGSADTTVGSDVVEWLWTEVTAFGERPGAAFVEQWQANPTPVDPSFLAEVTVETTAVRPHVWRGVARALMTEDQRRFLRDIAAPTLILWGEKDAAFSAAHQQRLRQALPHATFKAFPEVGHNLHWEIPRQVAVTLRTFLAARVDGEGRAGTAAR